MVAIGLGPLLLGLLGAFTLGLPAGSGFVVVGAMGAGSAAWFVTMDAYEDVQPVPAATAMEIAPEAAVTEKDIPKAAQDGPAPADVKTAVKADANTEEIHPVDRMIAIKDEICKCKDMFCVAGLQGELTAAGKALSADPTLVASRASELAPMGQELAKCMQRLAVSAAIPK